MSTNRVAILGSTGSVGCNTLDVIRRNPDRFRVQALTAHDNLPLLVEQCSEFQPVHAVIRNERLGRELQTRISELGLTTTVLHGPDALVQIAADDASDTVMAAIVGAAGLLSSLAAARSGKKLLLANKESLVMSGALFMDAVRTSGTRLLPIDSEHNAIYQCLPECRDSAGSDSGERSDRGISRLVLTASGGPLLRLPLGAMRNVTPDQACAHPNWRMGRKISVDSATMMNKGLEVIEACWLFDVSVADVDVLIHPQSVIHSMVQYRDGSVLAQLGQPDMRTPIAHGLAWPERIDSGVRSLDLAAMADLHFEAVDLARFPCLRMAMEVARTGNTALSAVLNAANEVAVAAFLRESIAFTEIAKVIGRALERFPHPHADSIDAILALDAEVRNFTAPDCGLEL